MLIKKLIKASCALALFSGAAVNLHNDIHAVSILFFMSGCLFMLDTGIFLWETRPRPIRYPQKGGLKRLQETFKELYKRKPSQELIDAVAPPAHPECKSYLWHTKMDPMKTNKTSDAVKILKKRYKRKKR